MNLRTNPTAGTIRKVKLSGIAGIGATLLLVAVNYALQKAGLPLLTEADAPILTAIGTGIYGGVVALVQWITAYRARPAAADVPVDAAGRAVVPANLPEHVVRVPAEA